MGKWIALLEAETPHAPGVATPETDKTPDWQVVGVLGVPRQGGCANSSDPALDVDVFEERAAIMEFDAGMTRADAEVAALICASATADSIDSTDSTRTAPAATDIAAAAWTEADSTRYITRRDHLMRWGWPEPEAERVAERLTLRDRDGDTRVCCTECTHYRPHRCGNHERAGLHAPDVGRDLAAQMQQCSGFITVTT